MTRFLRSWGRYPYAAQNANGCSWRNELPELLSGLEQQHTHTLAYGNGRSYGDSCLASSDQVLHMRTLDRFMQADWVEGIVRVESGITLAEILAVSIPQGWFLPVTPGTQYATVGGAIANDVHGKNHHVRGTFGNHVLRFQLLRSDQVAPVLCEPSRNPELFCATIGGLGLTGVVTCADLKLMPISSSQVNSVAVRFGSLDEFFALSEELDAKHEYSVAWIDCLAKGGNAGRGAFFVGDHAPYGALEVPASKKFVVPAVPPVSLINNLSLRVFNELYWRVQPKTRTRKRVEYEPFFYPLDSIRHWNRVYGRNGFQQYQCVIPHMAAPEAIGELLKVIAESGQGSFLAVLKRCGEIQSPGLLSFPLPGTSLALDFPQRSDLSGLFRRLDKIVRVANGRLYPAKDAHMSAKDFQLGYPAWQQLETLRDPALLSRFWKRVTQ